jgi:hypothetical protein
MIGRWTSHLKDKGEISRFKSTLEGSKTVLERLTQILDEEEQALIAHEFSLKSFDTPSWAYKQAYINGERNRIRAIKKLIQPDQGETK